MGSKKNLTKFENKIYRLLRQVPKGRVTTYGTIAKLIRKPKASRAVGNALNVNPFAPVVPCHRVVKANGEIGGFASGTIRKIKILKDEGVNIKNGKVVEFKKLLYKF